MASRLHPWPAGRAVWLAGIALGAAACPVPAPGTGHVVAGPDGAVMPDPACTPGAVGRRRHPGGPGHNVVPTRWLGSFGATAGGDPRKDLVEGRLHDLACGAVTGGPYLPLAAAQRLVAEDWVTALSQAHDDLVRVGT